MENFVFCAVPCDDESIKNAIMQFKNLIALPSYENLTKKHLDLMVMLLQIIFTSYIYFQYFTT